MFKAKKSNTDDLRIFTSFPTIQNQSGYISIFLFFFVGEALTQARCFCFVLINTQKILFIMKFFKREKQILDGNNYTVKNSICNRNAVAR